MNISKEEESNAEKRSRKEFNKNSVRGGLLGDKDIIMGCNKVQGSNQNDGSDMGPKHGNMANVMPGGSVPEEDSSL